ncbi:RNHCP domain-containing protein, partial [Candidatus Peregrinibacteria bacterium]|nr:RNHCP domain-containing protein [Candidatus Peregrinibacteria bacterium]
MQKTKSFTVINESFTCKNCGHKNPSHSNSCRNHCIKCLYSLHLDDKYPGDRASNCHSLMKPTHIKKDGKKGWMIYHKCCKCGKIIPNKAAEDDD